MILTYGRILSAIEKTLWELVEKYQGVWRLLWNLVEGQERNMVQLERIGAAMEWKWDLEREHRKAKSGDEEEGSKSGPGESQEKGTSLSAFC